MNYLMMLILVAIITVIVYNGENSDEGSRPDGAVIEFTNSPTMKNCGE